MVPPSVAAFDIKKHLQRKDIHICAAGLIVCIKWSKTNQCADRVLKVPIAAIPGSPLCPLQAYKHMLRLTPAPPSNPAFLHFVKGSLVTLTYRSFTSNLRSLLASAGLASKSYSGHSFRRGGATFAFKAGVPGELIKLHGDWVSDAYLLYLNVSLQQKFSVYTAMKSLILQS